MIARLEATIRRLREHVSRSRALAGLLGLSVSEGTGSDPGLVMIQVDGLGRSEFEKALVRGEMPFTARLIEREHYRTHTFYSGLPANTPAVQAELFYGVATAVPAFSFRDRDSGDIVRMYHPATAAKLERRLAEQGTGLLAGGSAWSDVFTGGAAESHFCPASTGWGQVLRSANPLVLAMFVILNGYSVLRTAALLVVEIVLALVDCVRGLIAGHDLVKELKFVPTRVVICIALRELTTIGVKIDAARGLPIIHLNFLGYDEQAHRRGPDSDFAHFTLKGIDDAIARVYRAARRSTRRDYDVWIYSDHGQARTLSYAKRFGCTIDEAVARVCSGRAGGPRTSARGEQSQRVRLLGGVRVQKLLPAYSDERDGAAPRVAALGSLAHVYFDPPAGTAERARLAATLVERASVPMVLYRDADDAVRAATADGDFDLLEHRRQLLGDDHPFGAAAATDLANLCRHPEAGEIVLSGWRAGTEVITFALENGSHTGASPQEVTGFALLPPDALPGHLDKPWLRPADLREAALVHQQRHRRLPSLGRAISGDAGELRIMTYNVHSCIGTDGKLSPARIARVIAKHRPDIVALQELDHGRVRTGGVDQAHQIANLLDMDHHFHPAIHIEEERYGDAILTHLPMRLVRAAALPGPRHGRDTEPRGALWVAIELPDGQYLNVINTHLGLSRGERLLQARELVGEKWLGDPACRGPAIVLGDLNSLPGSPVYRTLSSRLRDAQLQVDARPLTTFFTRLPALRIDHVFVSDDIEVTGVEIMGGAMTRTASDHLPLAVTFRLKP